MYPLFSDGNKYLNTVVCEEGQRRHLESPVLMIIITSGAYRHFELAGFMLLQLPKCKVRIQISAIKEYSSSLVYFLF